MNSRPPFAFLAFFAIAISLAVGCSSDGIDRKETVSVKGLLTVDGKAEKEVMVTLTSVSATRVGDLGVEGLSSMAFTDDSGAFALSTYDKGDGVPPGEYVLTFTLPTMNMISMQYEGDRLNGKYNDIKTSETRVKVESGKPVDLGTIELTTK